MYSFASPPPSYVAPSTCMGGSRLHLAATLFDTPSRLDAYAMHVRKNPINYLWYLTHFGPFPNSWPQASREPRMAAALSAWRASPPHPATHQFSAQA